MDEARFELVATVGVDDAPPGYDGAPGVDEPPVNGEDIPGVDEDPPRADELPVVGGGIPGVDDTTAVGNEVVGGGPLDDAGRLGIMVELIGSELTREYEGTIPSSGTCTALTAPGTSEVPFTESKSAQSEST